MRKMLVIARREYLASVRTRAFLLGLLLMPVLMLGSLVIQRVLSGYRDTRARHVAVIDRTPGAIIAPVLEEKVTEYNRTKIFDPDTGAQNRPGFVLEVAPPPEQLPEDLFLLREKLSQRVRDGDLLGVLEVGPDVLSPAPAGVKSPEEADRYGLRYQTSRPAQQDFPRLAQEVVSAEVQRRRCEKAGVVVSSIVELLRPVPLLPRGLSRRDPETSQVVDASEESRMAPVIVPAALLMLMFTVTLMGSTPLVQSVLEEKMQRIAEVLLGSVRPFTLMMGKLVGMTGVSLTIAVVYLGGAWWAAHRYGFAEWIGTDLLLWFLLFQLLATLMYGSLFIAVGAACTEMRETQNLLWPVMLLACLPMFVLGSVIQEPSSKAVTLLSFFPFATPMLMTARLAVPPGLPWPQPALGVLVVLLTTLACVYAAGRIFRVGLLLQGKGARLGDIVRWVFRG